MHYIRFPGQYFDQETGLHDNRYRYYSPELGRYVSADPIGQFGMGRGDGGVFAYTGAFPDLLLAGAANTGNANVYSYALNRPLGLIDPLGLYSCTYSVGKHSMSCKANNPENPDFESDEAVSGQNTPDCPDCQNNPDRSGVQDAGPIPEGDYSIGAQREGSSRRDLAPLPGTSTDPRFGFQTHGCSNAATCSEGCIGFTSNSARDGFNNAMSREEGDNTLNRPGFFGDSVSWA